MRTEREHTTTAIKGWNRTEQNRTEQSRARVTSIDPIAPGEEALEVLYACAAVLLLLCEQSEVMAVQTTEERDRREGGAVK
jgi:hypothetical protein